MLKMRNLYLLSRGGVHKLSNEDLEFKIQVNEEILKAHNKVLYDFGKRLDNIEQFLANKRFLLGTKFEKEGNRV
jgi:hypothetical protein